MNKKSVVTLLLALIVCLGLCACGETCAYNDNCEEKPYEESIYCEKHKCKSPEGCGEGIYVGTNYCSEHKCILKKCENIREKGEERCKEHVTCSEEGCSNKPFKDGYWCVEHKCSVENCKRFPEMINGVDGAYCEHHDCDKKGCHNLATHKGGSYLSTFCDEHVCQYSDCDDGGYDEYGGYCSYHYNKAQEEEDKCNICGGSYTCADCGAEGLYCYNSSFGTGQDHYCSTHWADIAEYMYYDEDDDIYRSYYD